MHLHVLNTIVLRTSTRVNPVNIEEHGSTEAFEIVWLDGRFQDILLQNQDYSQIVASLKEYKLHFFENVTECKDYLSQLRTDAKIIFIINEQLCEIKILLDVHKLCPVKFIFVIRSIEVQVTDENNLSSQFIKVIVYEYYYYSIKILFFDNYRLDI